MATTTTTTTTTMTTTPPPPPTRRYYKCDQCIRQLYESASEYYRRKNSRWRIKNAETIKRLSSFTEKEFQKHMNLVHSNTTVLAPHKQKMRSAIAARREWELWRARQEKMEGQIIAKVSKAENKKKKNKNKNKNQKLK